jgi:hypothetical protein
MRRVFLAGLAAVGLLGSAPEAASVKRVVYDYQTQYGRNEAMR